MDIKEIVRDMVQRELREGGWLLTEPGTPTPPGPAPGPEFAALEARLAALESALGINSEDAP